MATGRIGVCSSDPLESLLSRGYDFSCLPLSDDIDATGCDASIVPADDLHAIDSQIRQESIDRVTLDIGYLHHHGIHNVLLQGPLLHEHALLFAHSISALFRRYPYLELSIMLPMCAPTSVVDRELTGEVEDDPELLAELEDEQLASWEAWDEIRTICEYHPRLHVALQLPPRLPAETCVTRWLTEDIRYLVLSAGIFLTNQKGYPVLPKGHQLFIGRAAKFGPAVLLEHIDRHTRLGGEDAYLQYVKYLLKNAPGPTDQELFAPGYADFLQQPLQPLQDDLAHATYEVFEKDAVKYAQYEEAIRRALHDRIGSKGRTIIAVVGAGRGPLVDCCLRASSSTGRPIKVFAVEKNTHACVGLRRRLPEWQGKVELVEGDMRSWEPNGYVDILVSELLGSFGDNELSPECLDGVQRVLDPESGISIPQRYTPFVQPIMAPGHYSALLKTATGAQTNTTGGRRLLSTDALETPYVVLLSKFDTLSHTSEPLWHFHHPSDVSQLESLSPEQRQLRNKRYGRCRFDCDRAGSCHGLAGYFEAVLYPDVELSTVPETRDDKCPGMMSWFPLYLPLVRPLKIPRGGGVIEAHVWRDTDAREGGRKVWYAWRVDVLVLDRVVATSGVCNMFGDSYSLAL